MLAIVVVNVAGIAFVLWMFHLLERYLDRRWCRKRGRCIYFDGRCAFCGTVEPGHRRE